MQELTREGRALVDDLARRHGLSPDAVATFLRALVIGQGRMAQFDHPALGGMGQWAPGGMVMVGDMFNHALKAKVDALGHELAAALRQGGLVEAPAGWQAQSQGGGAWWPAELGAPASTGAQNETAYAFFPATRRLAVLRQGRVTVYDTADHRIGGFSQQQAGMSSFGFTSQHGPVALSALKVVDGDEASSRAAPIEAQPERAPASGGGGDVVTMIERLAELKAKGILSEAEFAAKKAELLSRL